MSDWSNLAKVVYKRTYARKDGGVVENWEDTCRRAIRGNLRIVRERFPRNNYDQEEADLFRMMSLRKGGPAGRGYWFSGTDAHTRLGGAALCNCFSGEESFVTSKGIVNFRDSVGQEVQVLDRNRSWVTTRVEQYGEQELFELVLNRYGKQRTILVTGNHNWEARRTSKDALSRYQTQNLPIGGYIPTLSCHSPLELSYEGIAHGITFGDGTRNSGHGFSVRLCSEKIELSRFFARSPGASGTITLLPDNYKDLPSLENSRNYLAGFFAGMLATDGCISSAISISNKNLEVVRYLENLCAVVGIETTGIREERHYSNYTNQEETLYVIGFPSYAIPASYILRSFHRERFVEREKITKDLWKIQAVRATGQIAPVYCVSVPTTNTFTLKGDILTGNCWGTTSEKWTTYVMAMDLLMLGGGVGMSVEHRYTSKLPKVKQDVTITHKATKDSDFIVPDSREGWTELFHRVLESYFVTGRSFSFSTICVRGYGEPILGFGGTSSGPSPLISFVANLSVILGNRSGKYMRPLDAADLLCATGELVVSGNVRRSAILILGDAWDRTYLTAKRWDLGSIPTYRAMANFSVVCDDVDDLHPLFWATYEHGEAFGIINRKNIQMYGRMGEQRADSAIVVNPCSEATLEGTGEPCNLAEQALANLDSPLEFFQNSVLCYRYAKRVTLESYHHPEIQEVVNRNRRVGVGITGCLQSPLFKPEYLDAAYRAIQMEDAGYSAELGVPLSIRTTVIKPSGTMSKVMDQAGEGLHAAYSRHIIQRVRFGANDGLIPQLRRAGHHMEPVVRFDGSLDQNTLVVDFYVKAPEGMPCADEGFDTWKQLDTLLLAQRHWADQAVSVTVYYKREELPQIKAWLRDNLKYLKTISFLCHSEHGFKQAPKEPITAEVYEELAAKISPLDMGEVVDEAVLGDLECSGGVCPVR